jgi:putative ABC transport system permease protein
VTSTAIRFALALAWRETRGSWRGFLSFLACVALGVAALAGVGTLGANLDRALAREARALLGGDVEARSARPFDTHTAGELAALAREGATVTYVRELVGMARGPDGRTLLVELKAVEPAYPLYGHLEITPSRPLGTLVGDGGVVVGADLPGRLGLRVGDRLALGAIELTVRGVLEREPDRPASVVALGPRVLLAPADLDRAALIQPGSRVRYRALVRLPAEESARDVRDRLTSAAPDAAVRVVTFDDAQPGLRRFFSQATTYLGLVGLVSLLVGGIGVASSVATFLRRRLATIAILKTVGAESGTVLLAYVIQAAALGVAGSVAGAALGVAMQPLLVRALGDVVTIGVEATPHVPTVMRALAMGVLATLLCALWPLVTLRAVKPSLILRNETGARLPRAPRPYAVALPIVLGLAGLACWQAGSLRAGAIFVGASIAALVLLAALGRGVALIARRVPAARSSAVRHGVASLYRPGGQTAGIVVALGAAVMLLVSVALLERSLLHHLDHAEREQAPSFFFIDIQPDQRDRFEALVTETGGVRPDITPVVRARLAAVQGEPVTRDLVRRRASDKSWFYTRDYVLTWSATPPPRNTILRGQWWNGRSANGPLVSIEEEAARVLGVDVGSRITFDVQGVPVEAEIANVRAVDWQTFGANFFVIFAPGALDGAPAMYLATARVPPSAEARVQDAVVTTFPNVTAIPVRDVLERVASVVDRLGLAVRAIGIFSLASGIVVMLGALAATRYQRLYESVILRTIGATRATVARAFAVEYGCLGIAAGAGGTALAALLAWIVLRFVLAVPWTFEPLALAGGVVVATMSALGVGFLATFRLLGAKPLAVLRQE